MPGLVALYNILQHRAYKILQFFNLGCPLTKVDCIMAVKWYVCVVSLKNCPSVLWWY